MSALLAGLADGQKQAQNLTVAKATQPKGQRNEHVVYWLEGLNGRGFSCNF
jgi:hypothetical protein